MWRPKAKNKYKPIIYHDVDNDLYVLKSYGKAMTLSPTGNLDHVPISFFRDSPSFTNELMRDFRLDCFIDTTIRQSVLGIITDNGDYFYEEGISRHMFDFEFCLDIGDS